MTWSSISEFLLSNSDHYDEKDRDFMREIDLWFGYLQEDGFGTYDSDSKKHCKECIQQDLMLELIRSKVARFERDHDENLMWDSAREQEVIENVKLSNMKI